MVTLDTAIIKEQLLKSVCQDNEWLQKYIELVSLTCSDDAAELSHKHHIVPKFYFKQNLLATDNSQSNLVKLSYINHILAHYYLCLCTKDDYKAKACFAFFKLYYAHRKISHEVLPSYADLLVELPKLELEYSKACSAIAKDRPSGNKNKIAIHTADFSKLKYVAESELPEWEKTGWIRGGRPTTVSQKEAVRKALTGIKRSAESKLKVSMANKGRMSPLRGKKLLPLSQERKEQLSNIVSSLITINKDDLELRVPEEKLNDYLETGWTLGTKLDRMRIQNQNLKGYKIRCVETNQVWVSMRECEKETGIPRRSIKQIINGKSYPQYPYHFERL